MRKVRFSLICLIFSILLLNVLSVEFCMANSFFSNTVVKNHEDVKSDEAKSVQNVQFFMTDAKHNRFRKENKDYMLADTMLNFTWNAIKKQISKKEFPQILKEQRFWLEQKRNDVANSFSLHLGEVNAFTLALVVRTQALANKVSKNPERGVYLYSQGNKGQNATIQGGHINVRIEGDYLYIEGQSFAKNGNTCEIEGMGAVENKGWTSLTTSEKETFFILFTQDAAYIIHDKIDFCGKNVSFQGVYTKNVE